MRLMVGLSTFHVSFDIIRIILLKIRIVYITTNFMPWQYLLWYSRQISIKWIGLPPTCDEQATIHRINTRRNKLELFGLYSNWLIKVMLIQYFLIRKFPNFQRERERDIPRKFDSSELCFLIEDENYHYDYYISPKWIQLGGWNC